MNLWCRISICWIRNCFAIQVSSIDLNISAVMTSSNKLFSKELHAWKDCFKLSGDCLVCLFFLFVFMCDSYSVHPIWKRYHSIRVKSIWRSFFEALYPFYSFICFYSRSNISQYFFPILSMRVKRVSLLKSWSFDQQPFNFLNFWDEAWWFLSFRFSGSFIAITIKMKTTVRKSWMIKTTFCFL